MLKNESNSLPNIEKIAKTIPAIKTERLSTFNFKSLLRPLVTEQKSGTLPIGSIIIKNVINNLKNSLKY